MKNEKKVLFLILKTWSNETIGIYDYSSSAIKIVKAFIIDSTFVVRTKNNLFLNIEQHADIDNKNGDDLLFYVNNNQNDIFILMNPLPKNLKLNEINYDYINNKIWYVLKTITEDEGNQNSIKECNEDYYLQENDLIKLGRVKYAVQKIKLLKDPNNSSGAEPAMAVSEIKYNISDLNKNLGAVFQFDYIVKNFSNYVDINEKGSYKEGNPQIICEDCKNYKSNETDDGENPLISFCKCQRPKHFKCLKKRLKDFMEIANEEDKKVYVESMVFKNFECNECGMQYPVKFKLEGIDKVFYLIDINEPTDCDFMILESIDYKQYEQYYKSIHIIKFLKETITIGRESYNDVVDKDISISRNHALLKLKNDKIYIENVSKKFGTQVLVRKPIQILDKAIYLQIGRTYVEARLINKEEYDEKMKDQKKE